MHQATIVARIGDTTSDENGLTMINALSFDVEDFFHVHGFADVISPDRWEEFPSRVADNTRRILKVLEDFDVRATFFVLGWVAEREPSLVREIANGGHELATHGHWHRAVFDQAPGEFAADVQRSLDAITAACPTANVIGYRAPSFSIVERSMWALEILRKLGLKYDSSIFPCHGHDRYGVSGAPRVTHRVFGDLWEIPPSTYRIAGRNVPVAGGGYFRLYPFAFTRHAIRRLNRAATPTVIYLHPWEFDPDQPVVKQARWTSRFRHYVNLDKTERRLRKLLGEFKFGPMKDLLAEDRLHGTSSIA